MSRPQEHPPSGSSTGSTARLGKYRLCLELASGGMGSVHLALTEGPHGFEKRVALKRIHPHLAGDPQFVAMFFDEARIAARLAHPNVCGVIDFGEADGTYYLTMPFLIGESLATIRAALCECRDDEVRRAAPYMFARLIADACEGLHAAHELRDERGEPLRVVHRDVSPENLFVGFEGTLSVLDFGVASARHRLQHTATGEVKGTLAYGSPEQLEGRALDRRSDLFPLGVVLWESLTLERLFKRDGLDATLRAVLSDPIPPLRDRWPDAPLALEEIVFKALSRDPERRYATAREMGRDLLVFLSDEGRTIGPPHVAEWIERLMPGAHARKVALIERSYSASMIDAMLASTSAPDEVTYREPETPASPPTPRSARRAVFIVGAVALVVSAVGLGAVAATEDRRVISVDPDVTRSSELAAEVGARAKVPAVRSNRFHPTVPSDDREVDDLVANASSEDGRTIRASEARGTVSIATPGGWALVYRGSHLLGEAPGTFRLPEGRHTLRVQPFGRGEAIRRRVRVTRDGHARLSVPVRP